MEHGDARHHAKRAAGELKAFVGIAGYLFVCFGAVILYRAALLADHGLAPTSFGLAVLKSLLIAKFLLVGQALGVGERLAEGPLAPLILYRSTLFLALVIVLDALEQMLVGAFHGHGPMAVAAAIANGRVPEMLANALLMWLILLPYFGVRELAGVLGPGELGRLLFKGRAAGTERG